MKKIYLLFCVLFLSVKINAQCISVDTVPYYEGFQSLTTTNQLPTCWAVSNPTTCVTYTNGNGGAAFYDTPAGTSSFYTNGVQLKAGVVYSVSLWYVVNSVNFNATWSNLNVLIGASQSSVGQTTIASIPGNVYSYVYTSLSNTFTVPSDGVYFASVRATSSQLGGAQYLSWDDFSITIPCTPSLNLPAVSVITSNSIICEGDSIIAYAAGANTYTWNGGLVGPVYADVLSSNTNISLVGTSTLTGCSNTVSSMVLVNPRPTIIAYTNQNTICKGSSINISAAGTGVVTYTWSTGSNSQNITVTPSVSISYSVIGSNTFGCVGSSSQPITVLPLPNITVTCPASSGVICSGDQITLFAGGASSYQWVNLGGALSSGDSITVVAGGNNSSFVVTGTDIDGCSSSADAYILSITDCVGLTKTTNSSDKFKVFPNPGSGLYTIDFQSNDLKSITITDFMGRVVLFSSSIEKQIIVDLQNLSIGVYHCIISSGVRTEATKLIKQ